MGKKSITISVGSHDVDWESVYVNILPLHKRSTTLAKKIETTARPGVQARALSSMHTPVVWHAWLSRYFGQGSRS